MRRILVFRTESITEPGIQFLKIRSKMLRVWRFVMRIVSGIANFAAADTYLCQGFAVKYNWPDPLMDYAYRENIFVARQE
jgi:hypothetical protein